MIVESSKLLESSYRYKCYNLRVGVCVSHVSLSLPLFLSSHSLSLSSPSLLSLSLSHCLSPLSSLISPLSSLLSLSPLPLSLDILSRVSWVLKSRVACLGIDGLAKLTICSLEILSECKIWVFVFNLIFQVLVRLSYVPVSHLAVPYEYFVKE